MGQEFLVGSDPQERVDDPAVAQIDAGRLDQALADIGVPWCRPAQEEEKGLGWRWTSSRTTSLSKWRER